MKSTIELSEYIPIAMNCWVSPRATELSVGLSMNISRTAGVTVSVVEPDTPESEALITLDPTPTDVATP